MPGPRAKAGPMLATLFQIALGGALGSVARYLAVRGVAAAGISMPFGTMTVNILGSFLIGVLFVLVPARIAPFLLVGVLGGFTTFSAFSLETMTLIEAGEMPRAMVYVLGSVILSVLACFAGLHLARGLA